jgi:hypothetical protein
MDMSNLWRQTDAKLWEPLSLDSSFLPVSVRIIRSGVGADSIVALLADPRARVRVNGLPIAGGLHILEHRDEILVRGERFYFSSESRPIVTVFHLEEGARRPTCPICRGALRDGEQAVRCPGCSRWFHQTEAAEGKRGRTCWTYAPTCRFCQHPTSLTGELAWRPEMEEEVIHGS